MEFNLGLAKTRNKVLSEVGDGPAYTEPTNTEEEQYRPRNSILKNRFKGRHKTVSWNQSVRVEGQLWKMGEQKEREREMG